VIRLLLPVMTSVFKVSGEKPYADVGIPPARFTSKCKSS
jgi:hypothetical protein